MTQQFPLCSKQFLGNLFWFHLLQKSYEIPFHWEKQWKAFCTGCTSACGIKFPFSLHVSHFFIVSLSLSHDTRDLHFVIQHVLFSSSHIQSSPNGPFSFSSSSNHTYLPHLNISLNNLYQTSLHAFHVRLSHYISGTPWGNDWHTCYWGWRLSLYRSFIFI